MRRILTALWTLVCLAVLVTITWLPASLGQRIGFAQFIAWPEPTLAVLGAIGVLLLASALVTHHAVRTTIAMVAVVVLVALPWGLPRLADPPRAYAADAVPPADDGALRVLAWNVAGQEESLGDVADVAATVSPQVIALPETTLSEAHELADDLAARGIRMTALPTSGSDAAWPSSVLVSPSLGGYRVVADTSQTVRPGIAITSRSGGPTIVVAHAQQPGFDAEQASTWREHLAWLAAWCDRGEAIIVGDFNGTDGNIGRTFGSCTAPGADAAGSTTGGTWPSALPAWLSAPIDRVYTSGWRVSGLWPIDGQRDGASDHRPIVTDLVRAQD